MYQTPDHRIWTGRNDPRDGEDGYLWHHVVGLLDLSRPIAPAAGGRNVALLGFASDEGVRRNQGRPGAKAGPAAIRKALCNMAVHFTAAELRVTDAGDVVTEGTRLEEAQEELAEKVRLLVSNGYFPILLGGGHEISYPHFTGLYRHFREHKTDRIGIVNIDAHFDFRSYEDGPHSGSPFRQLADEHDSRGQKFHYLPIGINPFANTRVQFRRLEQYRIGYIRFDETVPGNTGNISERIRKFADEVDHLYLTLDLDAISMASAPGVSAPAPIGISPVMVRVILGVVQATGKLAGFDVAELNPTFDDGRTARLAAAFIYEVALGQGLMFNV